VVVRVVCAPDHPWARWLSVLIVALGLLAGGPEGRVYVGAQRELGLLQRDSTRHRRYRSLLPQVPDSQETFTNVWRTEATDAGVYFQTYRRLFRWAPEADTMQSWAPDTQFQLADEARGRLYVNVEGRGLVTVRGDSLRLVPRGERFADGRIWYVVPHGDDGLLMRTDDGLLVQKGDTFRPFPTDADSLLAEAWPTIATRTADGSIAIGTVHDGLLLLGPDGTLRRHLRAQGAPLLGNGGRAGRRGGVPGTGPAGGRNETGSGTGRPGGCTGCGTAR